MPQAIRREAVISTFIIKHSRTITAKTGEKDGQLIKFRIDVDYPYPSRTLSFIYLALGLKIRNIYLKNLKIIAKMINESPENTRAYWFFTVKTLPDQELLSLINNDRHEVGLHVVKYPLGELQVLERETRRRVLYFTIHGTERLLGRLLWKREIKARLTRIPKTFRLFNFQKLPIKGFAIDKMCYDQPAVKIAEEIRHSNLPEYIVYFHPEWLFQRGKINRRGPYYEALRSILNVDKELENLAPRKKIFFTIASDLKQYEKDIFPTGEFIEKIREIGVDIFTFLERKWCFTISNPVKCWVKAKDNIALLRVTNYHEWWKSIGKKTRNMVRKAEKSSISTKVVKPNERLAEGIWKIYNETPIRQDRAFPHYGESRQTVTRGVLLSEDCVFIGAFLQDELVGFIQLIHGENIAIISQILALQKHSDKAVNNALVAKAIEICAAKKTEWIMYGRMGNHPSLDNFKQSNGFTKYPLTRYYVPISTKGRVALKLGLHRELKDALPAAIKYRLIPFYNWVSRTKMRAKMRFSEYSAN